MLLPRKNQYVSTLFDDFWNHPFFSDSFLTNPSSFMKTDIKEQDDSYQLEIDLPGCEKGDIQAKLEQGYLTVQTTKNENKEQKDENGSYIRRERYSGSCKRTFFIGESIKQEDIKASFDQGVLKLSIPKETPKSIAKKEQLIAIE